MAGNDIVFCHNLNGPNIIKFGPCEIVDPNNVTGTINATIDQVFTIISDINANYDSNVWRGVVQVTHSTYTPAIKQSLPIRCDYSKASKVYQAQRITNGIVTHVAKKSSIRYGNSLRHVYYNTSNLYTMQSPLSKGVLIWSRNSKPVKSHLTATYARTLRTQSKLEFNISLTLRTHSSIQSLFTSSTKIQHDSILTISDTRPTTRSRLLVYTHGNPLTPGYHRLVPNSKGKKKPERIGNNNIVFCCPGLPNNIIRFNCCTEIVPSRRVYIVNNSFSLVRLDNNKAILCESFSISSDVGSWTWVWSAKGKGTAINDILANNWTEPVVVIATLNNTEFKLIIEKVSRDRSFGSDGVSFSGRGWSALLDTPYAPTTTLYSAAAITAQQACQQALTFNSIPIGWDVDWFIDDWLIAGKALSNVGTYISHILTIVEAGGGYVQPSRTLQSIRAMPYYGANNDNEIIAPWNWETELSNNNLDVIVLPESVCETESIEWTHNPEYNAIWISGGEWGGRLDKMIRIGTAGDYMADTISSSLATDPIMTRQRGIKELGQAGRMIKISLSLPIIPELGIAEVGALVKYVAGGIERIGIVRGVSVNYSFPKARQSLEIESHEYL